MHIDQLVESAIGSIADHLARVGAKRAGRIANDATDELYRLIANQLWQTAAGLRVLDTLKQHPSSPTVRRQAVDLLRDEAESDARFTAALDEAARRAGLTDRAEGGRPRGYRPLHRTPRDPGRSSTAR